MFRTTAAVLTVISFLLTSGLASAVVCDEPVEVASGMVLGQADTETATCSWLGIPYAAPPVGELRWKAPAPVPDWEGVYKADTLSNRCAQKGLMKMLDSDKFGEISEDCLYLNVWRPEKSGPFPVMVWIHGGGYTGGTANSEMYWGDRLADAGDVVLVSMNYRLNVFGFLAHPALREDDPDASTGSYGSLDQVAAIQWVQDNIEFFGGDPNNVTIFGESAGGWSVCTMLASPLNKGKIHGAVLESGGCIASASLEKGYEQARGVAEKLGCGFDDLDCMRAASMEDLLEASGSQLDGFVWVPHHDGHLLTSSPLDMISDGDYNKVPFIAGFNRDEVDAPIKLLPTMKYKMFNNYPKMYRDLLGMDEEESERVAALYPLSEHNGKPAQAFGQAATDAGLACPTYDGLMAASLHQEDTWLYRFDFDEMKHGKFVGAFHAMEIPFIFDSHDRKPVSIIYNKKKIKNAEPLTDIMQLYWVNFAAEGDPNGEGLPEWPPFDPDSKMLIVLDMNTRPEPAGMTEKCAFWEAYNKRHGPIFEDLRRFIE